MIKFMLKIKRIILRQKWIGYLAVASLSLRLAFMPIILPAEAASKTPALSYNSFALCIANRLSLFGENSLFDGNSALILQNGIFAQPVSLPDISLREIVASRKSANTKITKVVNRLTQRVTVTAYSSTPDQTDSTPFITANGTYVYDGLVAANFLPFHSKVRFPEIFGDKIFTVEDRMAKKNSNKIDIWMPSRELALEFGVKRLIVEIVE